MSSLSWFSKLLLPWYRENHRPLPWRETKDPYRIWLSEVMLQQTRVEQGQGYYLRFVKRWPSVLDLASAHENDVLKEWQGLGYYSRARNLLKAAQQVIEEHGGKFPDSHADLLKLKGVGDYTAAAIGSICFDLPEAVVDGNVYRVLSRVFGIDTPIDSTAGRLRFKELATDLLDTAHPGDHNQAVMELGATVCTPRSPDCPRCPVQARCDALATGTIAILPIKEGKTKTRDRFFNYLRIATGNGIYMRQRAGEDIWTGLYELPLLESNKPLSNKAMETQLRANFSSGWEISEKSEAVRHVLSHQIINAIFWTVVPPKSFKPPADWERVALKKLDKLAVPRLIERWLNDGL
ncbi:MAG: A/G-specific adenine glycosylase [Flavobacteriales bacterium]